MELQEIPQGLAWTGLAVARSRADETARDDRLFTDDYASMFCDRMPGSVTSADDEAPFVRGYFALRTAWFDAAMQDAADGGIAQFVVLGAGLDSRAHRLDLGRDAVVYEVDLDPVMEFKDSVLTMDPPSGARRVGVAADLTNDWAQTLCNKGFEVNSVTHWTIEGVLPYLPPDAVDRVVDDLSSLTRQGSLALEHISTATLRLPPLQAMLEELTDDGAAWRSGIDDPLGWVGRLGWSASLTDVAEYAQQNGRPVPPGMNQDVVGPDARCWWVRAHRPAAGL